MKINFSAYATHTQGDKIMSGIIDEHGQQWEHCNVCNKFIAIETLGYVKPRTNHPYGTDICASCANKQIRSREIRFDQIQPAADWITYSPLDQ